MKEIRTKSLHLLIQVKWENWKYEPKALMFKPDNEIWCVGLDVNCELCAYTSFFNNESAAYVEVSFSDDFEEFHKGNISEGTILRSHAVYNQFGSEIVQPKKKFPFYFIKKINNSGLLKEGFRSIFFPENTGIKISNEKPLYMHVQTKGFLTAGLHCNLYCLTEVP